MQQVERTTPVPAINENERLLQRQIDKLTEENQNQRQDLTEKQAQIVQISYSLNECDLKYQKLLQQFNQQKAQFAQVKSLVDCKSQQYDYLQAKLANSTKQTQEDMYELRNQLNIKDNEMQELQQRYELQKAQMQRDQQQKDEEIAQLKSLNAFDRQQNVLQQKQQSITFNEQLSVYQQQSEKMNDQLLQEKQFSQAESHKCLLMQSQIQQMQTTAKRLKNENEATIFDLQGQIQILTNALNAAKLKDKNRSATNVLQLLHSQTPNTNHESMDREAALEEIAAQMQNLKSENEQKVQLLEKMKYNNLQSEKTILQLQNQLAKQLEAQNKKSEQQKDLESQLQYLEETKRSNQLQQKTILELQTAIKELQTENQKLKEENSQLGQSEKYQKLEAELRKLQKELKIKDIQIVFNKKDHQENSLAQSLTNFSKFQEREKMKLKVKGPLK